MAKRATIGQSADLPGSWSASTSGLRDRDFGAVSSPTMPRGVGRNQTHPSDMRMLWPREALEREPARLGPGRGLRCRRGDGMGGPASAAHVGSVALRRSVPARGGCAESPGRYARVYVRGRTPMGRTDSRSTTVTGTTTSSRMLAGLWMRPTTRFTASEPSFSVLWAIVVSGGRT